MCGGVQYQENGQSVRVLFSDIAAKLPVKTKSNGIIKLPWGRRIQQSGNLPLGGLARLDAIYGGRWDKWFPKPVKLAVSSFMMHDVEGQAHWFPVVDGGQFIQGLVAREGHEQRVYVVMIECDGAGEQYDRWPRIILSP